MGFENFRWKIVVLNSALLKFDHSHFHLHLVFDLQMLNLITTALNFFAFNLRTERS